MNSEGSDEEKRVARRLLVSLLLSFVVLAAGVVWTLRIAARASEVNHRLGHLEFSRDLARSQQSQSGSK